MNIPHISVSRADLYNECPYKYKLKYHDKIPSPIPEPFYFVYGKIIHKIAEVYVVERGARGIKEVAGDVLGGAIDVDNGKKAPPLPAEYRDRIAVHLRNLERLNDKLGAEGITEKKFNYDLDTPNSKYVLGFIDRIVFRDDKIFIFDYKTTKKGPFRENKESIRSDPQLRMYSRVVQREFGVNPKDITACLFYVEDGQFLDASYSEESLASVERELLNTYNQIKSHPPEGAVGKVGYHCNRCEYRDMCPFFKNSKRNASWDGDLSSLRKSTKR